MNSIIERLHRTANITTHLWVRDIAAAAAAHIEALEAAQLAALKERDEAREALNQARQQWGEKYTAIANAAKSRTIGVDLPEWVAHLEARVAYYETTLTSSNPQYYRGFSAQQWCELWDAAYSTISELRTELLFLQVGAPHFGKGAKHWFDLYETMLNRVTAASKALNP